MSEHHPEERELALCSAEAERQDVEDHLRWCRSCRSLADEHRWLDEEISTGLRAEAGAAPVPRPHWGDVQVRIETMRRRWVTVRRLSAVASVTVALVALLVFSAVIAEPGEQAIAASIEPTLAPQPAAQARLGSRTPTVAPVFSEGRPPAPTPILRPAPSIEPLTSSPSG
jgi:predicted anti-sigma-YlaC factor YlaD